MGDHNNCFSTIAQLFHLCQYFPASFRVQHGSRLVKDQDLRVQRQHPRQRSPLFLPAGQARRRTFFIPFQPDQFQRFLHFRCNLPFRNLSVFQTKSDILFQHRRNKLIIRILEYHAAYPAQLPLICRISCIYTVYRKITVLKRQQSIHQTHKRGFSTAVTAKDRRPFALFQLYIRLFKYRNALPVPEIGKSQSTPLYHHFIPVCNLF